MKKLILIVTLLLVGGCGITANTEYKQLINNSATWAAQAASMAENGDLTSDEMVSALRTSANQWAEFNAAVNKRTTDGIGN